MVIMPNGLKKAHVVMLAMSSTLHFHCSDYSLEESLRSNDLGGVMRSEIFPQRHILTAIFKLLLSCTLTFASVSAAERSWTSADGREIQAELVSYDVKAETVLIKTAQGEFELPFSKISEKDQVYIRGLAQKELEPEIKPEVAVKKVTPKQIGKITKKVTNAGNSYHVYYPKSYSADTKPPMLILFSPGGGGRAIINNFRKGADALGWVLVGCDKLKNGMNDDRGGQIFTDLLADIEAKVDHDPELLYMGGMSGGALRAYKNSAFFDRPWRGIIACGGWLGGSDNYDLKFRKKMAVAIVNGDNDENANHYVDDDMDVLEGRRCDVEYFSFSGGHKVGPPELIEEAMRWVAKATKTR